MGYVRLFLLPVGVLLLLALPLFVIAMRNRRTETARSFLISAGVVGMLCGIVAFTSRRQVAQCLDAGNSDCVDSGAVGLQLVMIAIYALAAWAAALSIAKE